MNEFFFNDESGKSLHSDLPSANQHPIIQPKWVGYLEMICQPSGERERCDRTQLRCEARRDSVTGRSGKPGTGVCMLRISSLLCCQAIRAAWQHKEERELSYSPPPQLTHVCTYTNTQRRCALLTPCCNLIALV